MGWMPTHPKPTTQNNLAQTSLIAHLAPMVDPRIDRRKEHDLVDILVIAICTLLCGGEGFNDMEDFGEAKLDWFKTFLRLRNGIPSHDTFNRVLRPWIRRSFWTVFSAGPRACAKRCRRRLWRWMARRCGGR